MSVGTTSEPTPTSSKHGSRRSGHPFRASYNRAVRAPNIVELFSAAGTRPVGHGGSLRKPAGDGCANRDAGSVPAKRVSAQQFGQYLPEPGQPASGPVRRQSEPEAGDRGHVDCGVILQPRFVPNLAVTVDYFNIHVKNIIGSLGLGAGLNGCMGFDGAPQNNFLCQFVHRAPKTCSLCLGPNAFVPLTNVNQPGLGLRTRGIDFNAPTLATSEHRNVECELHRHASADAPEPALEHFVRGLLRRGLRRPSGRRCSQPEVAARDARRFDDAERPWRLDPLEALLLRRRGAVRRTGGRASTSRTTST